ncbi:Hypothetical predicted protein [Marmota monax]|uniref:Uncharacterized protein n=1 Tax=Marmota monax TaxID=9995 RepID=A0A5E4AXG4_MARMO|nr:hypothetical protein GHT09_018133 [Marmota monax]VTJ61510.1 Hypothetical predicted protein [Marmota monax]
MLSKMDMTTKQLMNSRIVWVARSSGDDTGDRLVLWRCWDCPLCLHRRAIGEGHYSYKGEFPEGHQGGQAVPEEEGHGNEGAGFCDIHKVV